MNVVFWGVGLKFNKIIDKIKLNKELWGMEKVVACDSNPLKWGKNVEGIDIVSPLRLKELKVDLIVITTSIQSNIEEIIRQLLALGYDRNQIITYDKLYGQYYAKRIYEEHYNNYKSEKKDGFNKKKVVVYTVITNNYDCLKEPKVNDENITYVCFTDNHNLMSKNWNIEYIKGIDLDGRLLIKYLKMHPHLYFNDYETSIWVDGSLQIIGNVLDYVEKYEKNSPILHFPHYVRKCIYEEAKECIEMGIGEKDKILSQISNYQKERYPLNQGLYDSGVIVREHKNELCIKLMEEWYQQVEKYSTRDQISLSYIYWKNNFVPDICDLYYKDNPWFKFENHLGR